MPLHVCPWCSARTRVPDAVLRFKCPKCAAEIDTSPDPVINAQIAPGPPPVRDDYDDEPPRRRRRRREDSWDEPRRDRPVRVLVEATAKRWKLMQLFGSLAIVVGTCMMCAGRFPDNEKMIPLGAIVAVPGLLVFLVGRFGAWFNHG